MVGHVDINSRHVAGDYPELFGAILEPFGIELVPYELEVGRFPSDVAECDGWLCSPSRLSTYDPVPWLADAEELLRRIVTAEVPYVGICFGHQLLAQALGAVVAASADGWGVGVRDYEVVADRTWMEPTLQRFSLIGSHQDQVMGLPDGAELLFRSDYCPIGGFTVGERAWTLQVHPEFVPALADHLLLGRMALIGAEKVAQARASLGRPVDSQVVAAWMARFFTQTP